MSETDAPAPLFSLRTVWARKLDTPLRHFLRTETGSAVVLLAATLAALIWANADPSGYDAVWRTELSIRLGGNSLSEQLLDHQGALTAKDLIGYATRMGLDQERFTRDLLKQAGEAKIFADMDSADLSGVSGTPTFFVNGKRHHGAYDLGTLAQAVQAARARELISATGEPHRRSP